MFLCYCVFKNTVLLICSSVTLSFYLPSFGGVGGDLICSFVTVSLKNTLSLKILCL